MLHVGGADNASPAVVVAAFGAAAAPQFRGLTSGGTAASPSAVASGAFLGGLSVRARYDASNYTPANVGFAGFVAAEAFTVSA